MRALENAQFQNADKYAAYLKTPTGKLRAELTWENLRRFLPDCGSERRVLDLGGGTGCLSVRLARKEFQVVLLDSSEAMLAMARKEAAADGVAAKISFRHADASRLCELFEPESFDIVVCHNLLEYLADPAAIVAQIAHILRKDAVASVVVRNRAGEVLRAAINSGDCELAKANLSADMVLDSLFGKPVRVFDPREVSVMLTQAGLEVIAQYGVRVLSDYLKLRDKTTQASYPQLVELELTLGAQPEFACIARYTQMIARRFVGNGTKESTQ